MNRASAVVPTKPTNTATSTVSIVMPPLLDRAAADDDPDDDDREQAVEADDTIGQTRTAQQPVDEPGRTDRQHDQRQRRSRPSPRSCRHDRFEIAPLLPGSERPHGEPFEVEHVGANRLDVVELQHVDVDHRRCSVVGRRGRRRSGCPASA